MAASGTTQKPKRPLRVQRRAPKARAKARPIHGRLEFDKREIRILHLLPSFGYLDPIKCELNIVSLDSKPKYEALSYVWGDPQDRERIVVDGVATDVSTNLCAALRRLRGRTRPRDLWVDAICINQDDDAEKSHQVNLMRDVYSLTTNAILWLGDYHKPSQVHSSPDDKLKSRGTPRAESCNTLTHDKAVLAFDLLKRMASGDHFSPKEDPTDNSPNAEAMLAVSDLTDLPWWTRVWTIQEAILPGRATLLYGAQKLPLDTFLSASSNAMKHWDNKCCAFEKSLAKLRELASSIHFIKVSGIHLEIFVTALSVFRNRQAFDPRDHIYALLGLGGTEAIEADYTKSIAEVLVQSTRELILHTGGLKPLIRIAESDRIPGLPTWVPDWRAGRCPGNHRTEFSWLHIYPHFNAARGHPAQIREAPTGSILDVQGAILDRIHTVDDLLTGDDDAKTIEMIEQWQHTMERGGWSAHEYPTGGTYRDAFWRLVVADIRFAYDDGTGRAPWIRRACQSDEPECRKLWDKAFIARSPQLLTVGTRFFITEKGLIAVGHRDIRVGDSISVLLGGQMPFILRQDGSEEDSRYEYHGQAYVHGIMDGEALADGREPEWISLV